MHRTAIVIVFILLTAACKENDLQADFPALLSNPGTETLQEIEYTLSAALNGTAVTLAADVFTENSMLVIQRNLQRSIDRPPELGRDLGQPYRFQLISNGTRCALLDLQSEQHWPLASVECVEE